MGIHYIQSNYSAGICKECKDGQIKTMPTHSSCNVFIVEDGMVKAVEEIMMGEELCDGGLKESIDKKNQVEMQARAEEENRMKQPPLSKVRK
jgi:hypothetical protein